MSEPAVEQSHPEIEPLEPLSRYGLASDPFESPSPSSDATDSTPFFMGGDRRAVLDEIMHLCQFGNNLVAVLGEAGVGKTVLVHQAIIELSETATCCLIQSSVMLGTEDVLLQIASQLGVHIPEGATLVEILAAISQYVPLGAQQRVVIIVDDAHHLNDAVLKTLVGLLQDQQAYYLHVLLVGDSSLLLRLDKLDTGEVLTYDIPLCPFKIDELEAYLNFKMAAVGYVGTELFDSNAVQSLWRDTRGIPASVNHAARTLLLDHTAQDESEHKLGLPIWHMAVVVVLLAMLIMALFYMGDDAEVMDDSLSAEAEAITSIEIDADNSNRLTDESSLAVDIVEEDSPPPVPVVIESNLAESVSEKPQAATIVAPPSISTPPPAKAAVEATATEVAVDPLSQGRASNHLPEVKEIVAPRKEEVVEARPQPKPSSSLIRSAAALTVDEQAVMSWPSSRYTLQVIAASQRVNVERFVASQSNSKVLRIVAYERNNSPWYVVLVGVYESVEEAKAAIIFLPSSQRSASPWPRNIAEVKRKIQQFRRR